MAERALAHVEVINNIAPIEKADKIEVATVLGWRVVVKKDEFKVGDKVIYIEIDSKVPELPAFFEEFPLFLNLSVKIASKMIIAMAANPINKYVMFILSADIWNKRIIIIIMDKSL